MNHETLNDSIASLQDCLEQIQSSKTLLDVKEHVEQADQLLARLKAQVEADVERQQEEALQKRAEVQEAYQAKAKFVSVVTHELRTPMTSIKGYTDLLRSGVVGPLNEQQSAFLSTIRNNVERMSALVSDLSDLNHMDTGRMHLDCSPFPILLYVTESIRQLQSKIDEKRQSVEIQIPDSCPPIYADKNRFAQVLTVLLSNANRYTPDGGCIQIRAFQEGEFTRLEVIDNGIGISDKDQEKLFSPFFRSEDPAVREIPGWGLGLAVAKRLVELMRGEVGVRSQLKNGSKFWFTLPITPG